MLINLYKQIQGKWNIDRIINKKNIAKGYAFFTAVSENKLKYEEVLDVIYENGFKTKASRKYFFVFNFSQQTIEQLFENEDSFCTLKIENSNSVSNLILKGYHLCINDEYFPCYNFIDDNNFSLEYKVKGPEKELNIFSNYKKCARS